MEEMNTSTTKRYISKGGGNFTVSFNSGSWPMEFVENPKMGPLWR